MLYNVTERSKFLVEFRKRKLYLPDHFFIFYCELNIERLERVPTLTGEYSINFHLGLISFTLSIAV